jgi:hypothetical protein
MKKLIRKNDNKLGKKIILNQSDFKTSTKNSTDHHDP